MLTNLSPADTANIQPNGKLIYLLINDESLADDLRINLQQYGYQLHYFSSINDFTAACEDALPAAFIMDIVTGSNNIVTADIIAQLKNCPPVIFISEHNDIEMHLAATRAGAHRYFVKPVNIIKLVRSLNALILEEHADPYRVLMIDDEESVLKLHATILRKSKLDVKTLSQPLEILTVMEKFNPDVIVIDIHMPGCSGHELARIIRQNDDWSLIPVMFLSSEINPASQQTAMKLGGDDFLLKPVDPAYLLSAISARAKRARKSILLNNQLKETLRENKYQLATMDQHDIVSSTDVTGKITSINDRFCEISGYSREELLGQNHRLLKSDFHPNSFFKDMWRCLAKGEVWRGTICNRKKNGDEYWVESTIVPFLNDKGKPYKYFSARTDVTEVRKNEERLHRSQTFANIGTWDWNIVTGKLFWSDRIGPLFGYDKDAPEANYDNFIAAIHPDDRNMVQDAITSCVGKGTEYNIEHRVVWPNGDIHWVQEKGDVVRSEDGKPLHMLGVVQDINKRKSAQKKLIEARDEAEHANLAKSQFLSSMSHELRTPMNAILGFGQLLKMEGDSLDASQQENIDEIIKAGRHLLELINDVLDLSRIEEGRIDLSIEAIALNEVVIESLQLIMPLAQKRGIEIKIIQNETEISFEQLSQHHCGVKADRVRLRQVLLNLMSNAVKYNNENGKIIIACSKSENDQQRISIIDTGEGLSSDQQTQLFTAFERMGAERSEIEGTGIGLMITKKIIELMGGSIGVESQPGEGSTFWVDLPTEDILAEQKNIINKNESEDKKLMSETTNEYSVLYIEDNPANLRLVSQLLRRRSNINLLTAHEPILGLELAMEHKPDLILLDINLPGINGFEVLKQLREYQKTKNIQVIAISANAMPKDIEKGRNAGFDDYITKPIDVNALLLSIDARLSNL